MIIRCPTGRQRAGGGGERAGGGGGPDGGGCGRGGTPRCFSSEGAYLWKNLTENRGFYPRAEATRVRILSTSSAFAYF